MQSCWKKTARSSLILSIRLEYYVLLVNCSTIFFSLIFDLSVWKRSFYDLLLGVLRFSLATGRLTWEKIQSTNFLIILFFSVLHFFYLLFSFQIISLLWVSQYISTHTIGIAYATKSSSFSLPFQKFSYLSSIIFFLKLVTCYICQHPKKGLVYHIYRYSLKQKRP